MHEHLELLIKDLEKKQNDVYLQAQRASGKKTRRRKIGGGINDGESAFPQSEASVSGQ